MASPECWELLGCVQVGGGLAECYGPAAAFGATSCAMLAVAAVYSRLPETLRTAPPPEVGCEVGRRRRHHAVTASLRAPQGPCPAARCVPPCPGYSAARRGDVQAAAVAAADASGTDQGDGRGGFMELVAGSRPVQALVALVRAPRIVWPHNMDYNPTRWPESPRVVRPSGYGGVPERGSGHDGHPAARDTHLVGNAGHPRAAAQVTQICAAPI